MKFTTETSILKRALQRLGFAVNTKSVVPATQNILVTVLKDEILLTTTDLMVTINYKIDCKTNGEGQFLIPFVHLKNIIALESGEVTVEWDIKTGATTKFEADTFCLGNPGESTDFPKIQSVSKKGMIELNKDFVGAMGLAALGVGSDDNKPVLMNICIELDKNKATVTATDANSIYTHAIDFTSELAAEKVELLVPTVVAKAIDGFDTLKIGFNKNNVAFESGPLMITTKRAEGNYVAWRNVMPLHNPALHLNLFHLKDAVNKAYVMSDATYKGIDFFIEPKSLGIKTDVAETGMSCSLNILADATTPLKRIRFNGRLLKRMIEQLEAHAEEESEISFSLTEANKQSTVQLKGKEHITVLLMPVTIT